MFYGPRTVADTHAYLERMLASQREEPRLIWELGAVVTADDRLVGACDLTLDSPQEADLGFIFSQEVWGMGYATEAVGALLGYVASRGHTTAVAWCDVDNLPSWRVLERLGFALVETVDGEHRFTLDLGEGFGMSAGAPGQS
jgi:RimJ/RimL family protein N-acetyltransferase